MPPSLPASAAASWLGTWSKPPDRPAQIALAVAVALAVFALTPGGPGRLALVLDFAGLSDLTRRKRFLLVASFATAFLSLGYIAFYLRGGPRAAEAATYWLQGRALSHGSFSWTAPGPTANFRTADVILTPPDRLTAAVPPGFPLLLAATFLVGAPMLIGPALAAALVTATWALAHEISVDAGLSPARTETVARMAAGLSIVSVTLRYLTAETLPHATAALALALALTSALRAARTSRRRLYTGAGAALGFLLATDPAASLAAAVAIGWIASRRPNALRSVLRTAVAAAPGVLFLMLADRAATGHAFTSGASFYATSVVPRVALGSPRAAAVALLRCARTHAADVANLEPLLLLAVVPLWRRGSEGARVAALTVVGGAALHYRLLADPRSAGAAVGALAQGIPIEHALIALGLAQCVSGMLGPAVTGTLSLAVAGYAVHTSFDHLRRAQEGLGHPRYESDVVREANVTHGLLFFEDDTGYALAHDPATPASHGLEAVRMRGDDHDRLLYDALGHPPSHRYSASGSGAGAGPWGGAETDGATIAFFAPGSGSNDFWRFEAESEWPPVRQFGGLASIEEGPTSCAFGGRDLSLTASGSAPAALWIELPAPRGPTLPPSRSWTVIPRVVEHGTAGAGTLALFLTWIGSADPPSTEPPAAEWSWSDSANRPTCIELSAQTVTLNEKIPHAWLRLGVSGGQVALDAVSMRGK